MSTDGNHGGDAPLPVYLVHYDAPDWVTSAADTALNSDIAVDVCVIDNGPPGVLGALDRRVRVEPTLKNFGFAGGANVALREWLSGSAPFCVIGSHDLHVARDCFSKLLAAAADAPDFGILAPVVPTNFRGATIATSGDIEATTIVSGTCMLLRRDCIAEIGLFDAVFRSYCEDNELCARATRHGWQVGTVTTAHARGLGTRHHEDRATHKQKNRLLLAWRVGGARGLVVEYARCIRALVWAIARKRANVPGAVVALTVGTGRLARGIVTRPARA